MEYVDKLATSAAETAYIGGAEHMSTIMCETLNSANAKVKIFMYLNIKIAVHQMLVQPIMGTHIFVLVFLLICNSLSF